LTAMTVKLGHRGTAQFYGVSTSSYKKILVEKFANLMKNKPFPCDRELENTIRRTGSVRLTARLYHIKDGEVREWAKKVELELAEILRWDESNASTGKGRRAELDAMSWRGDQVVFDANKKYGPRAEFDFMDVALGRVNVKSSVRWKYKASTRKEAPYYWKFSTRGLTNCDRVLCVFYDDKGAHPVFMIMRPEACLQRVRSEDPKSFQVGQEELPTDTS